MVRPPGGEDGMCLDNQNHGGVAPAAPPFVQAPLEIPAIEVRNCAGAEACPGKNKLAIHAASLSGPPGRPPASGRPGIRAGRILPAGSLPPPRMGDYIG